MVGGRTGAICGRREEKPVPGGKVRLMAPRVRLAFSGGGPVEVAGGAIRGVCPGNRAVSRAAPDMTLSGDGR